MLPDITNRLNNLTKALETVIVPAIPGDNPFAHEQAALMLGHLKMLAEQWDGAYLYERGSLHNMRELARRLAAIAAGGPASEGAAERAGVALGAVPAELPLTVNGVNALTIALGKAVDDLICAAYADGSDAFRRGLFKAVLQYNTLQATRERIWFKSNGLDPDGRDLGDFQEMLHGQAYLLA